ncbi:extracellular solute-binding protein [Lutibaculum baratangense]|uniref:ABC transporter, periplasmic substrate-binding protein n=1 Tax=Lutibaculum baratangense AMV1 TaxID=631454 RepID=V4RHE3_9HYPH|nr:extracellular solute-binding protein [Lutibaculum baratangense]ESR25541.1 ABC transporter, periplasmic substrate-binding protein [Lutibaculum baratangense AMV1]
MKSLAGRLLLVASLALSAHAAAAQEGGTERDWNHGLSLFGELKYGPGFERFDYVNPDAPKAGRFRQGAIGSFDTLNPFNIKGSPATGLGLTYDTLMATSLDEPSSEYGLVAESVSHPDDYSSVTFRLRPEARFHDGTPVTAEDVVWSLEALKDAHPFYNAYYRNVVEAEVTGENEVTFTFDEKGNRELPQITGQIYVLPKHYWEGTDANGNQRDFKASTLEPPLGSGPYRIKSAVAGRSITYELVEDYWAKDLPVRVGSNNFAELSYEYYRDMTVALEAFKADRFDFRSENSATRWATGYDFPAARRGDVVLETFQTKQAEPMQGLIFNLRRERFQDPRVREAFNLAYDFEWLNQNIFYGQYERTGSYFPNSELAATGLPEGKELEILEEVRDKVPPEVFTQEYKNPVGGDRRNVRENFARAGELLTEAGWIVEGGQRVNRETGEAMRVEFLTAQPDTERVLSPYIRNLERLGIQGTIRNVDSAQYQNRMDNFNFDMTVDLFPQSLSPGNEQRDFWGSAAADTPASRNTIGIKNEAVDRLIDRIIYAEDRETLVAASRALDRVLLWNHYLVPQFYTPDIRTARWDRFGLPETMPDYAFSPLIWWWDEEKAATIKSGS